MRGLRRGAVIVLAAAGIAASPGASLAQEGPEAGRGYPSAEWPLVGGNWSSSRYSTLDDIRLAPRTTDAIETATLMENPSWSVGGRRYAIDEHAFNPVRARVTAGARVRFVNDGELAHTVAARDGSWTTGALQPATWEVVTFDEPGTFRYHCTEHPWAVGEITVEP